MKYFNQLGLAEPILRALNREGYTTPTPIQAGVIPAMLSGRDIVGIAQTGTGKTAAFVLPLLQQAVENFTRPGPRCCNALILAPTRELAAQIMESIRVYGQFIVHSRTLVVGGAKAGPQIKALGRGVDIVVATPGRLEDHMRSGAICLDHTTMVVLDEADQMMDLGFMPSIRRIMARVSRNRQSILLSATMPKEIRKLANDFLHNPAEISITPSARPIELIEQKIMFVEKPSKRRALTQILAGRDVSRTIVFTRTKRGADGVKTHLERSGFSVTAIHGNRSQRQREKAMHAFRAGHVEILVATDVAARGIDVDDISHIVNFELPNVPESYVHRIGRTARAGKGGIAISLCDGSERKMLRDIERLIGADIAKEQFAPGEENPIKIQNFVKPEGQSSGQPRAKQNHQHKGGDGKTGKNRKAKNFKYWSRKKNANPGGGWTGAKSKSRGNRRAA